MKHRSSAAITLALIGSTFLLGGCNRNKDDENKNQGGGRGMYIAPRVGSGVGGGVSAAPSARGGFGSSGASSIGS